MKKTRRIAAFIAAMAMAATMAVPFSMTASAVSQSVTVSVKTDGTGNNNEGTKPSADATGITHNYTAYEVFKGEYVQTAGAGTEATDDDAFQFNVTDLGGGVNWTALLTTDSDFMKLKPDGTKTIADVLDALGSGATNAEKAAAIAQVIGDNIETATPQADELAKIFAAAKTGTGTSVTATGVTMTEGYYLVTDSYEDGTNNDAVSKFILQVAKKVGENGIVIVPKKSYPTVIKKVQENVNDITGTVTINGQEQTADTTAKYNDVADYDIGSPVPFKLYGSMPATLSDYAHYYYKFTDTLGSQFDQPTSITITIGTTTLTATWETDKYTVTGDTGTNCRVTWNNGTLTISFEDIKAYTGVNANTIVTVAYTAVLNDTANIGLPGQVNAVKLAYSNNPNFEYTPDTTDTKEDTPKDDNDTPDNPSDDTDYTDETPEDKVIVFTYELDVTKIDGTTKANLPGAVFNLKKGNQFAKVVTATGKFVEWVDATITDDATYTTSLTSDANGLFKVSGIDDGTYTLVEVTPPAGYNPLTTPVSLTIDATTANNQSWDDFVASNALTAFKLDSTAQDEGAEDGKRGHAAKTIENNKGTELPATGGMGTKAFVAGGGLTALLAGVWLATKKRMGKED